MQYVSVNSMWIVTCCKSYAITASSTKAEKLIKQRTFIHTFDPQFVHIIFVKFGPVTPELTELICEQLN